MTSLARTATALLALVTLVGGSAPAWADKSTRVYTFSSANLDPEQSDMPEALTRAIARAIHARVQPLTLEDAALALDCDPEQRACLEAVLGQAGASEMVYGTVTKNMTGKLKIVLTVYSSTEDKKQQTYVIGARDSEDASDQLVQKAGPQLGLAADPDEQPGAGSGDIEDRRGGDGRGRGRGGEGGGGDRVGGGGSSAGVTNGTYGILGVGAAATLVGIGFIVSAQNVRNQIATAPDKTHEDLVALVELEAKGKQRATIGYGLIAGGLAVGLYGILRAVHERDTTTTKKSDPVSDPDPMDGLGIAPVHGGAALVFSGRFR